MKLLLRILWIVAACGAASYGQSLSLSQFHFFNHLFKSIADPMEDPSHGQDATIFQRRQQTEATRYGLNQAETTSLKGVAQAYYALAVQWQQQVTAIAGGKTDLLDSDRAALAKIEAQRRAAISQLAATFLASATPQTKARFAYMMSKDINQ
jgi:hypothetical protein